MRGTKPHLVVDNDAVTKAPAAPSWLSAEAKKRITAERFDAMVGAA